MAKELLNINLDEKEKWFKLINEEFSEVDQEWQWTYLLLIPIIFNEQIITKITITSHYQKEHKDIRNNEKTKWWNNETRT